MNSRRGSRSGDAAGRGDSFFEFQVNPLGTICDSFVADASRSCNWQEWSKWHCQSLEVGVNVNGRINDRSHKDSGWSAEIAIPFDGLQQQVGIGPQSGDVWRVNFCRYQYAGQPGDPELSCWAPTLKVFDDLGRFGSMVFGE